MDINALGQPANPLTGASKNLTRLPTTKPLATEAKPAESQQAVSVSQATPALSRPAPVERVTRVEPALTSNAWNNTLAGAMDSLPNARGWQAITLGLGQLSHYGSVVQSAKTQLLPRTEGTTEPEVTRQSSLGKMTFSATLASGTEVSFAVDARAGIEQYGQASAAFRAIDVHFSADGELTDEEQAELDAFSKNLGAFVSDFITSGGPDLNRLKLTEFTAIESLQLQVKTADKQTLSLAYTRDAQSTSINLQWNGRSLNLSIAQGAASQQGLTLLREALLENLDKARAEASDTRVLMQALSLFGVSAADPAAQPDDSAALLTGLPDYQLSFKGVVEYPASRTEHHDKFSGIRLLTIGQSTHINNSNGQTSISQTQNISLEAAYFTPLPLLDDVDLARENFKWNHIDESRQVISQQVWQDDWLKSATVQRSASIQNMQQTWSEGELIDKWRDEQKDFSVLDVRLLLNTANTNDDSLSEKQAENELRGLINPIH
ncbi:hypothetical protein [Gilvimarinus japonicus]|uniref:Uncharacterized protein n=1 Tax=Gilvimarinus japonicus TaxID=1796469 RepID=A0ABV7HSN0_9GAMM